MYICMYVCACRNGNGLDISVPPLFLQGYYIIQLA